MKGLLGRKIGMTQVYTDHGQSIAVSVIEVKPNVVTSIFTKEKDGYTALQLGVVDIKKHLQKKPQVGHFKKAKTSPKKFVKEIRGMEGFEIGQTIDVSIFTAGQLVDVTGIAKGKGFSGAIKRHNQSIGPKSHGGGGGSQPVRQTGSLGDISGNKVVKGMTMPGQMGNVQRTQQNLELISIDVANNLLLIKGSIPGPKKSYVVIKEAIKLLPAKEAQEKNELLEEAKKAGADVNTDMSVQEMKDAIKASSEAKEQEKAAIKVAEEADKVALEKEKVEVAVTKAKEEVETKTASGDDEGTKEAKAKVEVLEKQKEAAKVKVVEVQEKAKQAEKEAKESKSKAEEFQVKKEDEKDEPENREKSQNKEGDK